MNFRDPQIHRPGQERGQEEDPPPGEDTPSLPRPRQEDLGLERDLREETGEDAPNTEQT